MKNHPFLNGFPLGIMLDHLVSYWYRIWPFGYVDCQFTNRLTYDLVAVMNNKSFFLGVSRLFKDYIMVNSKCPSDCSRQVF